MNGELRVISAPQVLDWPKISSTAAFVEVYDWDVMMFNRDTSYLKERIELCFIVFPCALEIHGDGNGAIERIQDGTISCLSSAGCIGIVLNSINIVCKDNVPWSSVMVVKGTTFKASYVSFSGCLSDTDGSIVKAYDAATLLVDHSKFENVRSLGYGGAIALLGSHAYITNTSFLNCSAVHGGGAIWVIKASVLQCYGSETSDDVVLSIDKMSTFLSCSSSGPGGSILASSDVRAVSSKFGSFLKTDASVISVQNVIVDIKNTLFSGSKSEKEGGAVSVSSISAVVEVFATTFSFCTSASIGGAVYAGDKARANISNTVFHGNTAHGIGGGALYSQSAKLVISNITSTNNSAFTGGGGVLFWEGNFLPLFSIFCSRNESNWPLFSQSNILKTDACYGDNHTTRSVEFLLDLITKMICGPGNDAVYGQCVASDYKKLEILLSSESESAYPGLPFSIRTLKKDAYNQTITTDSESIIQVFQSTLQLRSDFIPIKITGNSIVRMNSGFVIFSLALSPVFSFVDFHSRVTSLLYEPDVYISGTDSQTGFVMRTNDFRVNFQRGRSVCPKGYILDFDMLGSKNGSASCSFCKTGTYSVNPLAHYSGSLSSTPSCLNCPVGGDCSLGGYNVIFDVGDWMETDQMYLLVNCPKGYQLINSSAGGNFIHGLQECKRCLSGQYIINPNMDSCHKCPQGIAPSFGIFMYTCIYF